LAGLIGVEIYARGGRDKLAVDEEIVARLQFGVGRLGRGIELPEIAEDEFGQRGRTGVGRDFFAVGVRAWRKEDSVGLGGFAEV
jgi:hypothetical protein